MNGQAAMGILYHNGLGVPRDYIKACYLFEEAANIGNPFDVYNFEKKPIGDISVRPDLAESLEWFREAAGQDNAGAQFCLAVAYFRGLMVEKDQGQVIYWLEKAATLGNPWSQYYLAHMYEEGIGVEKSSTESAKWLEKAALQEFKDAQAMLGVAYFYGESVPQSEEKAKYWLRKAIENGVSYGPPSLASGNGVKPLLKQWFDEMVMGLIHSNAPGAAVLQEEARRFHGMHAWIAAVEIAGGGVLAKYDSETGTEERQDSVRGFVVFRRGDNVFALMCEVNVMSFFDKSRVYDPNNWDAFIEELDAFYSTMKFSES